MSDTANFEASALDVDESTTLVLELPSPLPITAKLSRLLGDAFPGSTVSGCDTQMLIRIPHTAENLRLPDEEEASEIAVADVWSLGSRGDAFAVSLGTDAEVAGFLAAAFRGVLDRHDAPSFVTMTVSDPVSGDRYEVEVRRGGALSAASRIAELEAQVAELSDELSRLREGGAGR